MEKEGVTVKGVIIDRRKGETNNHTTFYITYRFSPENSEQSYTREASVEGEFYHSQKVGDTLSIRYLATNPEVSRLPKEFYSQSELNSFYILGAGLSLPVFFIWGMVWMSWYGFYIEDRRVAEHAQRKLAHKRERKERRYARKLPSTIRAKLGME